MTCPKRDWKVTVYITKGLPQDELRRVGDSFKRSDDITIHIPNKKDKKHGYPVKLEFKDYTIGEIRSILSLHDRYVSKYSLDHITGETGNYKLAVTTDAKLDAEDFLFVTNAIKKRGGNIKSMDYRGKGIAVEIHDINDSDIYEMVRVLDETNGIRTIELDQIDKPAEVQPIETDKPGTDSRLYAKENGKNPLDTDSFPEPDEEIEIVPLPKKTGIMLDRTYGITSNENKVPLKGLDAAYASTVLRQLDDTSDPITGIVYKELGSKFTVKVDDGIDDAVERMLRIHNKRKNKAKKTGKLERRAKRNNKKGRTKRKH